MAWFHDYNRDYDRSPGYDRMGRNPRDVPGWRSSSNYGDDRYAGRDFWSSGRRDNRGFGADDRNYGTSYRYGSNYDYLGRNRNYEYDYDFRRRPEESPAYGRGGDQAVQRWARRYGYDMQYEIQPRNRGGSGSQQGGYGGAGRGQGGYGAQRQGGWNQGATSRDYGGDYRW